MTILEEIEEVISDPEESNESVFEDMIGIISEREDGSKNQDHYILEPKAE